MKCKECTPCALRAIYDTHDSCCLDCGLLMECVRNDSACVDMLCCEYARKVAGYDKNRQNSNCA